MVLSFFGKTVEDRNKNNFNLETVSYLIRFIILMAFTIL